jgi:hypothetical protein
LEEGDYVYREFWGGKTGIWKEGEPLRFNSVPANGCALIALRRLQGAQPLYAGSDLHISQGIEVDEWRVEVESLEIKMRLPRTAKGNVYLYLPGKAGAVEVNGNPGELTPVHDGIHRLAVEVEGFCHIHISYKKE